jgi:hypothetical protein
MCKLIEKMIKGEGEEGKVLVVGHAGVAVGDKVMELLAKDGWGKVRGVGVNIFRKANAVSCWETASTCRGDDETTHTTYHTPHPKHTTPQPPAGGSFDCRGLRTLRQGTRENPQEKLLHEVPRSRHLSPHG